MSLRKINEKKFFSLSDKNEIFEWNVQSGKLSNQYLMQAGVLNPNSEFFIINNNDGDEFILLTSFGYEGEFYLNNLKTN